MKTSPKRILKLVRDVLIYLVIIALAVVIILSVYSKATGKQVLPFSVMWVLTDSMEDTIPARSYILVTEVEPEDIRVGDIISFYSRDPAIEGRLNSHRVIEIIGDHAEFRTKGDHNLVEDHYTVLASDVVGRYRRNLPVLTFFGRLFATSAGLIVTFLLIFAGVGIWLALFISKNVKQKKEAEIQRRIAEEVQRLKESAAAKDRSEEQPTDEKND